MTEQELQALKYPTGKFNAPKTYDKSIRQACLEKFVELPGNLRQATYGLTDAQLDMPYRERGWSTRQIIHHLADSHMNSFLRFKSTLTEDTPTIKPYDQDLWASGPDAKLPIEVSLNIVEGIHQRLAYVLSNMSDADYSRKLYHPEMKKELDLNFMTSLYAWHGHHHLAQIVALKERANW